jgi:uncharacterized membrane protein HdeD (DUF308 family)
MNSVLTGRWWTLALRGAAAIAFGVIAFLLPGLTLEIFVLLFAVYAIVDGIFAILAGMRAAEHSERWWPFLLEGLLDVAAGVIIVLWPGLSLLALVIVVGAWAVVTGIALLIAAFRLGRRHGEWLLVLNGLVSLLLGVYFLISPIAGILVLAWWIGAYALIFGVLLVALALRLRHLHHHPTAVPA